MTSPARRPPGTPAGGQFASTSRPEACGGLEEPAGAAAAFTDASDIKAAVDAGRTVHWSNDSYQVIRDSIGQYLIVYQRGRPGEHAIGLTWRDGTTLNGRIDQFYEKPQTQPDPDDPAPPLNGISRSEALAMPGTETLTDGRCVGQIYRDENGGTSMRVVYCEHPGGDHKRFPEPGWQHGTVR